MEKLEAEMAALEVHTAEERASHAKLQADIEELELEHKRATVTADGLLPMLKLWYEAYKAEPAGGVAEAQVDAAFNGIASLLGQLDQHRAAVTEQQKEEEPPPTNVEDAIAASIPKPEVAAEVAQAVAAVAAAEHKQAGGGGVASGGEAGGGAGGGARGGSTAGGGRESVKPVRKQTPEELLKPRESRMSKRKSAEAQTAMHD